MMLTLQNITAELVFSRIDLMQKNAKMQAFDKCNYEHECIENKQARYNRSSKKYLGFAMTAFGQLALTR